MNAYNTQTFETVVRLEQALTCVLEVTRVHAPDEDIIPERVEDIPLQWAHARELLLLVEQEERGLLADMLRVLICLRQMHAAYVLSVTDAPTEKSNPEVAV
ncbi:hypothetical protein [Haloferax sp. ATB1]|uniref:hypothetical protein n=1 Tax=Haloferax sp. ATB1 TaxID=1508454 RepID=UPI0005B2327C|nr:hypothetical protein [Haloferax sp. ATB1]